MKKHEVMLLLGSVLSMRGLYTFYYTKERDKSSYLIVEGGGKYPRIDVSVKGGVAQVAVHYSMEQRWTEEIHYSKLSEDEFLRRLGEVLQGESTT